MKTLTIDGMHCDACQKLITIELEDAGVKDAIQAFDQPEPNTGTLTLKDSVTDEQERKIIEVISSMDGYQVKQS